MDTFVDPSHTGGAVRFVESPAVHLVKASVWQLARCAPGQSSCESLQSPAPPATGMGLGVQMLPTPPRTLCPAATRTPAGHKDITDEGSLQHLKHRRGVR